MRGILGLALDEDIFRPSLNSGPSGLRNPPRPFVLRTGHLDGAIIGIDEVFYIDVLTFDRERCAAGKIAQAFAAFDGAKFEFEKMEPLHEFAVDLAAPEPAQGALVHFLTPTEIKSEGEIAASLPFSVLFARIRDRVANLRRLYGDGPLEVDFRGIGERSKHILNGPWHDEESRFSTRRSSRTGQIHSIGGIMGYAEYEGELAEFVPWLRAACWTNVGRHTIWGNGQIKCEFRS